MADESTWGVMMIPQGRGSARALVESKKQPVSLRMLLEDGTVLIESPEIDCPVDFISYHVLPGFPDSKHPRKRYVPKEIRVQDPWEGCDVRLEPIDIFTKRIAMRMPDRPVRIDVICRPMSR